MDAYRQLREDGELGNRQYQVLTWLAEYIEEKGENPTARELFNWLAVEKGIGEVQLGGPNYVKPRITELKEMGYVEELGKKECGVTERKAYKLDVVDPSQKNVEGDDVYVDEDGQAYVFNPNSSCSSESVASEDGSESEEDAESSSEDQIEQKILFEDGEVVG